MARVIETYAGVSVRTPERLPAPCETKRNFPTSPRRPRDWKRRVVRCLVPGSMLLACLFGAPRGAWAQDRPPTIARVEPGVTQQDGIVTLIFSEAVDVASVSVGNVQAPVIGGNPTSVRVKVPRNTPLGTQEVAVTAAKQAAAAPATNGADAAPPTAVLKHPVIVAPEVTGLKANEQADAQSSRVAVAGSEIILQFSGDIPSEIRQRLSVKHGDRVLPFTAPKNNYLLLEVPKDKEVDQTTHPVRVSVDDTPLDKAPALRVIPVSTMYWRSSLILVLLILLVYLLYKLFYKVPAGQTRYSFLTMLLLEQENMTYSLSRAQFLGWMTVIIWSWLFLYYAHGYVDQIWAFPNLGNSVYTFLISLGTLIVAQATNMGQGVKGAGEVHPSPADLVVHGGVLALDRVQQVVWTVLAIGMFIRITVSTYSTATALPDIPQELLVLMGLSSAGYLGGKLVRGAGPIIEQVTIREGSVIINIKGKHFSKDCFVWVDGVKQSKDKISVIADDPDAPLRFAKELEVTLEITLEDWRAKEHALTVVNDDAQRADWRTGPEIVEVTAGKAVAEGKVRMTVRGARLARGATLEVAGAPDARPVQDRSDPNLFTVDVPSAWPSESHELTVTSGGRKSLYTYSPSGQTGGGGGETTDNAQSTAGEQTADSAQTGDGEQGSSGQAAANAGQPDGSEQADSGEQAADSGQNADSERAADNP